MHPQPTPEFRDLTREEIDEVLSRNHVGRLAFSHRDRVDIEPIHYVYDEGWIYGRTSPGTKLTTIAHNYWVAFEVDEIQALFRWRSVVVRGGFYIFPEDGAPREVEARERAIELLRRLVPGTFTDHDPVPFRTVIFGIAVQEVEGREATG
jgi:nitroimidazol reductase NimA-like FMN-containing flavoprotein (pyridoxamine 5'-phosphate oxidase superfamily)